MKGVYVFLLTVLCTGTALSQSPADREEVYDKIFTKTQQPPAFNTDLLKYFDSVLTGKLPRKGRVIIEVIIDSSGAPHFKHLYDHTNGDVKNLKLKEVIEKMPAWTPARQNGNAVTSMLILLLDFADNKLVLAADENMSEEMRYMLNSNKP